MTTAKHNIAVRNPDSFLTTLCGEDPGTVAAAVDAALPAQILGSPNPPMKNTFKL